MVRSTGAPESSTAMPSLHTSPSAWCTAPNAYDRSVTGHRRRPPRRRPARVHACALARSSATRARPPPGTREVGLAATDRTPRARPARGGPPVSRPSPPRGDRGRPVVRPTSTSSTSTPAQTACTAAASGARSAEPSVRPTRTMPVPSSRSATASGGRFGPRRTTSSRRHSTRTGAPASSASFLARAGTGLCRLPPNAPPLAERRGGRPARTAPAGVRLDVGRLDPARLQRQRPVALGRRHRDGTTPPCCCVPAPARCPPGRCGSREPASPRHPAARARPVGRRRRRSRRLRGRRRRPRSGRPDLRPGRARRRAAGHATRSRDGRTPVAASTPSAWHAASTMDCHPVQRQRWARRLASMSRRARAPSDAGTSSDARRMTMPGVQKPH